MLQQLSEVRQEASLQVTGAAFGGSAAYKQAEKTEAPPPHTHAHTHTNNFEHTHSEETPQRLASSKSEVHTISRLSSTDDAKKKGGKTVAILNNADDDEVGGRRGDATRALQRVKRPCCSLEFGSIWIDGSCVFD